MKWLKSQFCKPVAKPGSAATSRRVQRLVLSVVFFEESSAIRNALFMHEELDRGSTVCLHLGNYSIKIENRRNLGINHSPMMPFKRIEYSKAQLANYLLQAGMEHTAQAMITERKEHQQRCTSSSKF